MRHHSAPPALACEQRILAEIVSNSEIRYIKPARYRDLAVRNVVHEQRVGGMFASLAPDLRTVAELGAKRQIILAVEICARFVNGGIQQSVERFHYARARISVESVQSVRRCEYDKRAAYGNAVLVYPPRGYEKIDHRKFALIGKRRQSANPVLAENIQIIAERHNLIQRAALVEQFYKPRGIFRHVPISRIEIVRKEQFGRVVVARHEQTLVVQRHRLDVRRGIVFAHHRAAPHQKPALLARKKYNVVRLEPVLYRGNRSEHERR